MRVAPFSPPGQDELARGFELYPRDGARNSASGSTDTAPQRAMSESRPRSSCSSHPDAPPKADAPSNAKGRCCRQTGQTRRSKYG